MEKEKERKAEDLEKGQKERERKAEKKLRAKEKAENEKTIADSEAGLEAVKNAIAVLKEFYAKAAALTPASAEEIQLLYAALNGDTVAVERLEAVHGHEDGGVELLEGGLLSHARRHVIEGSGAPLRGLARRPARSAQTCGWEPSCAWVGCRAGVSLGVRAGARCEHLRAVQSF